MESENLFTSITVIDVNFAATITKRSRKLRENLINNSYLSGGGTIASSITLSESNQFEFKQILYDKIDRTAQELLSRFTERT